MFVLGGVQRGVLEVLESDGPHLLSGLEASVSSSVSSSPGWSVSRSSLMRAISSLEKKGLVRVERGDPGGDSAVFLVNRYGCSVDAWHALFLGDGPVRLLTSGTPLDASHHAAAWKPLFGHLSLGRNAWGFSIVGAPWAKRPIWMGYFSNEKEAVSVAERLPEARLS